MLFSELLIGCEYMNTVFQEIEACLPSGEQLLLLDDVILERCVGFVCDIAFNFFPSSCSQLMEQLARSLLLELFRVDLDVQDIEQGRSETWHKVRMAWCQGFDCLLANTISSTGSLDVGLYHQLSDRLISEVSRNALSVDHVQHLADAAVELWNTYSKRVQSNYQVIEKSSDTDLEMLQLPLCPRYDVHKSSPWQLTALLERKVTFNEIRDYCISTVMQSDISIAVHVAMFNARLLASVSIGATETSEYPVDVTDCYLENTECVEKKDDCPEATVRYNDVLISIAAELGVCQVLSGDVTVASLLPSNAIKCIESDLLMIIRRRSNYANRHLVRSAFHRSMLSDGAWSLALGIIMNLVDVDSVDQLMMTDDEVYIPLTAVIVSTLNVVLPHLPGSFLTHFAEMQIALLLSCPPDNVASHQSGSCFSFIQLKLF